MTSRYGLEIRAAAGADAVGLADLLALPARGLADRLEAMRGESGAVMLALEWGPPSGVIALHWCRVLDADLPVARITTLFVAEGARRRGIGRMLLKAGAQAARVAGCGALELLAAPEYAHLAKFCLATGFAAIGTRFGRALRKQG